MTSKVIQTITGNDVQYKVIKDEGQGCIQTFIDCLEDSDDDLLSCILGDERKLNCESLATRNEMFNFLEKRFGWRFNYWMEIIPDSENEIKRIHILRPTRMQIQWEFNGKLIFKAGRYDIFKYPQFGLDINIYD